MTEKAPERIWAVAEPDDMSAQIEGDVYAQKSPEGMVGTPTAYIHDDLFKALTAERDALAADNKRIRLEVAHASDTADAANEAARQAHILVSERDARIDALAAEVERLRGELIHKSTMLDVYECFAMGINKPSALTRRLAERRAALEEGKDG